MDIREKLNFLDSNTGIKKPAGTKPAYCNRDLSIPGNISENEFGAFFKSVSEVPINSDYGIVKLDLFRNLSIGILNQIVTGTDIFHDFNVEKFIFLDTETTGLAGGAGTVPFLTGMGYYDDDSFKVEQFLMRDFSEEKAVLHALKEAIGDRSALITYNGKCYDMNILASRFTISGMDNPFTSLNHLDLLFPVRRVWRKRIGSCSLANVEEKILYFSRGEDIHGSLIPGVYFDFIRTGNDKELSKVLRHNVLDIISLAAAVSLLGKIYAGSAAELEHWQDLISIGKIYYNTGNYKKAVECFKQSARRADKTEDIVESLIPLGALYKRTGRWEEAENIWLYIIKKLPKNIEIYEELAKYYEHRKREISKAIDIVLKALEILNLQAELNPQPLYNLKQKDFIYRLSRLRRKEKFSKK
ncbi:ribonuclease H-like domain-containing protein [bacterium]|nr:ribonuclease H-like domain-containing protein [bacterium]